jgi:hypothetical protein
MNDMRGHKNVISRDEVIQLINEYAGISKSSNDDVIINSAKDLLKL